ncbi:type VI secretion system lipoprotein TssJ [Reinekea sp.]|jgi:type VI secretion system protein VasD|uniref:type VI secretion system lipoprotein TssJ n=1 Tax=Reinekea sp. TaxID=1970455 RepID=UPI00398A3632
MPYIGERFSMRRSFLVLFLSLSLFGCATPSLNFKLDSTQNLNLGEDQQAYAVLVRFYQLNELSAFENASYESLWKNDSETLGLSLVSRKELIVDPDSSLSVSLTKAKATKALGLVAFYRDYSGKQWKTFQTISNNAFKRKTLMAIELTESELTLERL